MRPALLLPLQRWLARLRHPQLFALVGALFLVDLVVPDMVPFVDEILLLAGTVLLGRWKRRRDLPVQH